MTAGAVSLQHSYQGRREAGAFDSIKEKKNFTDWYKIHLEPEELSNFNGEYNDAYRRIHGVRDRAWGKDGSSAASTDAPSSSCAAVQVGEDASPDALSDEAIESSKPASHSDESFASYYTKYALDLFTLNQELASCKKQLTQREEQLRQREWQLTDANSTIQHLQRSKPFL